MQDQVDEEFYDKYKNMIFKIANALGTRFPRSHADDLVQTAWAKICIALEKYDPDLAKMTTFLSSTAYYAMLKQCNYERSLNTLPANDESMVTVAKQETNLTRIVEDIGPSDAREIFTVLTTFAEELGITTRTRGRTESILHDHFKTMGWDATRFFNAFTHLGAVVN